MDGSKPMGANGMLICCMGLVRGEILPANRIDGGCSSGDSF